jgi:hypothetical protein
MEPNSDKNQNAWLELFLSIWNRVRKAFCTPSFVFVFIVVLIACGGCGIWLPYLIKQTTVFFRPDAVLTYGLSIIASIIAETILSDERTKSENMLFFSAAVIATILLLSGLFLTESGKIAYLSIIGGALSLAIWFISNADDTKYDERQRPDSALGGAVGSSSQLSGRGLQ